MAYVLGGPARSFLQQTHSPFPAGFLGPQSGSSLDSGQKKGHTRSHCARSQPAKGPCVACIRQLKVMTPQAASQGRARPSADTCYEHYVHYLSRRLGSQGDVNNGNSSKEPRFTHETSAASEVKHIST